MSSDSCPTVGVVIPVYNDWDRLQQCLAALAVQTYPAERFEVRVVNNGSSDWPEQPQFPLTVEVLVHDEPGSYGARNRAALNWSVQVLAFTDADCLPEPDWLEQGVRAMLTAGDPSPMLAGRIRLDAGLPLQPTAAEQLDQILGFDQARTVRRAGYGVTANLFVAQSLFQDLGGFHAQTRSGGDRDFCRRACTAGVSLVYVEAAVVSHPARNWHGLIEKQRRIVGGRLTLMGREPSARMKVLWLSLRPWVSESVRVMRHRSLPYRRRLLLVTLVVRLRLSVLREWMRLQLQGEVPLR
jgi:glycosyltransferase involved in cell wall biosynthesis